MTPDAGPRDGGTTLTIYGHGFESSAHATCKFARVDPSGQTVVVTSPSTFIDYDQIQCVSPEWTKEPCLEASGGCEMILSVTNNGIDYSGGVMGFGGSTLKFHIIQIVPIINMPQWRHTYTSDNANELDQFVIGTGIWNVAAGSSMRTGQQFTAGKSGWLTELRFRISPTSVCNESVTVTLACVF